jgi:antirestriction protein ArdC
MENTIVHSEINTKKSQNENSLCITEPKKDSFIENLIAAVETANPNDWEHFLKDRAYADIIPFNPLSGTKYMRTNKFYLMLIAMIRKYSTNRYATFKQIADAGYKVKKGAKSVLIEYFNFYFKHKETGKKITYQEWTKLTETKRADYFKKTYLKTYRVFNLDEVEGVNPEDFDVIEDEFSPIDEIETFLEETIRNHSISVDYKRTDKAYYSMTTDSVTLPLRKYFESSEQFYATTFHELTHWTGNEKRLDRDMTGFFGNEKYAFEELVAELGSMLSLTGFEIYSQMPNSLAYLNGWLIATKDDRNKTLRKAFSKAKQALNYLENNENPII